MPHRGSRNKRRSLTEKGISSTNTPERIAAGRGGGSGRALRSQSTPSQSLARPEDLARTRANLAAKGQTPVLQSRAGQSDIDRARRNVPSFQRKTGGIQARFAELVSDVKGKVGKFGEQQTGVQRAFESGTQTVGQDIGLAVDLSFGGGGAFIRGTRAANLGFDVAKVVEANRDVQRIAKLERESNTLSRLARQIPLRTDGSIGNLNRIDDVKKAMQNTEVARMVDANQNALDAGRAELVAAVEAAKKYQIDNPTGINKFITQAKQKLRDAFKTKNKPAQLEAIEEIENLESVAVKQADIDKLFIGKTAKGTDFNLILTNRQKAKIKELGVEVGRPVLNKKTNELQKIAAYKWLEAHGLTDKIYLTKLAIGTTISAGILYAGYKQLSGVSEPWGPGEGLESLTHANRIAGDSNNPDFLEQTAWDTMTLREQIQDNPYPRGSIRWTFHNLKKKVPAAEFQLEVQLKANLDKADEIRNGVSPQDALLKYQIEKHQMERETTLYFNESRIATEEIILALKEQAAKESEKRQIRIIVAQIKLWEEYAERQRILDQQARERMAQFWLDYAKRKSSLGGLGFGLL